MLDYVSENACLRTKLYEAREKIKRLDSALKMATINYTDSCDYCPLIRPWGCGRVSSRCEDAVYKYFYDAAGERLDTDN